jgi:hypothetical protein
MMIALTVTEMEKVRGQPVTGYPVLMVLDEFAGLKRMEVIENAVAQIASYGVKLFFVLQSLEQLKAVYKDNWETFLANSGLKVFFNLEDHFSREYVSKLIGETEVIREVGSSNDSTSESEGVSKSVTRSQSETHGRSSSTGTSESEGTNSGKSWGINSSETSGDNYSYVRAWFFGFFRQYDKRMGENRSQSKGTSEGWSEGKSRGTSRSHTDGTSESQTTGTSETDGTTHGTTKSRTEGKSETIQKRALITPDKIGQVFARIDERAHQAYPGLALVVISGARPVPVRRVNYYEDYEFMGLFDPPPDYPYTPPKQLTVEGRTLGLSLATYGLQLGNWSIDAGQIAAAADEGALVVKTADNTTPARIRVPRAGKITAVDRRTGGDVPDGPLFSLMYYEDGAGLLDPFAEVRAFCEQVRAEREARQREEDARQREEDERRRAEERKRRIRKYKAVACCVLVAVIAIGSAIIRSAIHRSQEERAAALIREGQTAKQANPAIPNPDSTPMSAPATPSSTAPSSQSTVPPTDSQRTPDVGTAPATPAATTQGSSTTTDDGSLVSGGVIAPYVVPPAETAMVEKKVLVCVPLRVDYYGFGNPAPSRKMEAFRDAATKTIRDYARFGVNDKTQFWVMDTFDSFDPAYPDAHQLATVMTIISGANTCPAANRPYTLTVETKP